MSEYQYYEFRAVDRPLDDQAMRELRGLTSRAEITPTSLTNVYHFGDFRGNPEQVLEKYFDAFVYVANWGTREFMLRLPRRLFDADAAGPYAEGECLTLRTTPEHVLVEFRSEDEGGGDWEEGEGWMASLVPLRDDLLAGDLRGLYLGWLLGAQFTDDEDAVEPPVPPGLRELSAPLKALADFLRIDDWLEAAAETSAGRATGPAREELAAWVQRLKAAEKEAWLMRLAEEAGPALRAEFLGAFRQARRKQKTGPDPGGARRTVGELRAAAEGQAEKRRRQEAERAARAAQRRAREEAEARSARLDALAGREARAWKEVEAHIETKRPKEYDRAVELLKDLVALAERAGRRGEAEARIAQLRARHAGKSSLLARLDRAGFRPGTGRG